MGLVIDTCVFIRAEKSKANVDFGKWEKYVDIYLSSITVSELLVGVHCANNEAHRIQRAIFVENIIGKIVALSFNFAAARIHADLHAGLLKKGLAVGSHDLIIAATAIVNNCAVLTTNIKEFMRIPGLEVLAFE